MKPTKMRNKQIYYATMKTASIQLSSLLSENLRKKYGKKSVRVVEGDSVKVIRGEFTGVDGKVTVTNENNDNCVFDYDKKTLPYFWIFQSRGGWNNLNVNVLEPCNSGLKDLKEAVNQNMIFIPKSQNFKTWYTIEVS